LKKNLFLFKENSSLCWYMAKINSKKYFIKSIRSTLWLNIEWMFGN